MLIVENKVVHGAVYIQKFARIPLAGNPWSPPVPRRMMTCSFSYTIGLGTRVYALFSGPPTLPRPSRYGRPLPFSGFIVKGLPIIVRVGQYQEMVLFMVDELCGLLGQIGLPSR
jgi:hypothetical protein